MYKRSIMFALFFMLTACTPLNQTKENHSDASFPQEISTKNNQREHGLNDNEEKATYLSHLAASIPNVERATAIVIGDYTIIGIDVDKNLDRSKVGSIKYSVAESIKKDPLGSGAIVIADPDVHARLIEIREDMEAGRPIQGIMNELADITGRLMPETPQLDEEENPEDAPEQQKEEMNQQDEQKLEKEQEEQSYQMK